MCADRGLHIDVYRWERDAYTAFHPDGYQGGVLDPILSIDKADIVIAIFWARLGTSDEKLGGKTGSPRLTVARPIWRSPTKRHARGPLQKADPLRTAWPWPPAGA